MYLLTTSGWGHSSFLMTSKHWLSWVNTSVTEQEKSACSDAFWNCSAQRSKRELFTPLSCSHSRVGKHVFFLVGSQDSGGREECVCKVVNHRDCELILPRAPEQPTIRRNARNGCAGLHHSRQQCQIVLTVY